MYVYIYIYSISDIYAARLVVETATSRKSRKFHLNCCYYMLIH